MITLDDLDDYEARWVKPVQVHFHDESPCKVYQKPRHRSPWRAWTPLSTRSHLLAVERSSPTSSTWSTSTRSNPRMTTLCYSIGLLRPSSKIQGYIIWYILHQGGLTHFEQSWVMALVKRPSETPSTTWWATSPASSGPRIGGFWNLKQK